MLQQTLAYKVSEELDDEVRQLDNEVLDYEVR